MKLILSLSSHPHLTLVECPYNMMGYIWALKETGIKVIELQHGVINNSHYAYILPYKSIFSPDELWVFGDTELLFFKNYNPHYAHKVISIGQYILKRSKEAFVDDIFIHYRNIYEKVVVFSGQSDVEHECQIFISEVAKLNPKILFIYIPRNSFEKFKNKQENILFMPGVNIYEYLIWCDIHLTVSSTTCLEACYFDRPTIFYNLYGLSLKYYGEIFYDKNRAVFISSPSEFNKAAKLLNRNCGGEHFKPFSDFNIDAISKLLGFSKRQQA